MRQGEERFRIITAHGTVKESIWGMTESRMETKKEGGIEEYSYSET